MRKKSEKRLALNRETVRILNQHKLAHAAGGQVLCTTAITCCCPPTQDVKCTTGPACGD